MKKIALIAISLLISFMVIAVTTASAATQLSNLDLNTDGFISVADIELCRDSLIQQKNVMQVLDFVRISKSLNLIDYSQTKVSEANSNRLRNWFLNCDTEPKLACYGQTVEVNFVGLSNDPTCYARAIFSNGFTGKMPSVSKRETVYTFTDTIGKVKYVFWADDECYHITPILMDETVLTDQPFITSFIDYSLICVNERGSLDIQNLAWNTEDDDFFITTDHDKVNLHFNQVSREHIVCFSEGYVPLSSSGTIVARFYTQPATYAVWSDGIHYHISID